MNHRALFLALATLAAPATCLAEDGGVPPPERDLDACSRMRVMPDWCRDAREREQEPPRQRVRVRNAEPSR